jgi:serine/threonine protein kinase
VFHARRTESAPSGRFQREYEIKETLGRGGFGEVLKAENIVSRLERSDTQVDIHRSQLDGKMYAIKRIRLRPDAEEIDGESKIMREVKTLSRLNHRYIVRYFSAWIEDNEDVPTDSEATESSESQASSADTVHFSSIGKSKGRAFPFSHASFARLSRAGADASGSHIAFADDSGSGSGDQDDEPSSEEEDSFDGERSGEDTVDEDSSEESSFGLQPPVAFNDFPDSWKAQSPAHAKKSKPKPKSKPTPKLPNQTLYIAMVTIVSSQFPMKLIRVSGIRRESDAQGENRWRNRRGRGLALVRPNSRRSRSLAEFGHRELSFLYYSIPLSSLIQQQIHRDIKLANIFMGA